MARIKAGEKVIEKAQKLFQGPKTVNLPEAQLGIYKFNGRKEMYHTSGDVSNFYKDNRKGMYHTNSDVSDFYKDGRSKQERVEAEIDEASKRAREQGSVTGKRSDERFDITKKIKNKYNSVVDTYHTAKQGISAFANKSRKKSSEYEKKIKDGYNNFVNKRNGGPNDFQKQTTEMINGFSSGRYSGEVDTDGMNWLQAGAHKNLHQTV